MKSRETERAETTRTPIEAFRCAHEDCEAQAADSVRLARPSRWYGPHGTGPAQMANTKLCNAHSAENGVTCWGLRWCVEIVNGEYVWDGTPA